MSTTFFQNKVSVVIPTYNRASYIQNAIESIGRQKYENIEIVVIDDRSTDNTKSLINSLQAKHPTLFYYRNNRAKGPSGARNTGILNSTGEYIAFLDSDDLWMDGHLKKGMTFLEENPKVDVIFGNYSVVDFKSNAHLYNFFDKKTVLHELNSFKTSDNIKIINDNLFIALIKENFFDLGTVILKKSVVDNILFDESIMFSEDCDFGIKLFKQANATFAVRTDPVLIKNIHDSNLYFSKGQEVWQKTIQANLYLFERYLRDYHLTAEEKCVLHRFIAKRLRSLSYVYRSNRKYGDAIQSIMKSYRYNFTIEQSKELLVVLSKSLVNSVLNRKEKVQG